MIHYFRKNVKEKIDSFDSFDSIHSFKRRRREQMHAQPPFDLLRFDSTHSIDSFYNKNSTIYLLGFILATAQSRIIRIIFGIFDAIFRLPKNNTVLIMTANNTRRQHRGPSLLTTKDRQCHIKSIVTNQSNETIILTTTTTTARKLTAQGIIVDGNEGHCQWHTEEGHEHCR
jgi:hypothetical protein